MTRHDIDNGSDSGYTAPSTATFWKWQRIAQTKRGRGAHRACDILHTNNLRHLYLQDARTYMRPELAAILDAASA